MLCWKVYCWKISFSSHQVSLCQGWGQTLSVLYSKPQPLLCSHTQTAVFWAEVVITKHLGYLDDYLLSLPWSLTLRLHKQKFTGWLLSMCIVMGKVTTNRAECDGNFWLFVLEKHSFAVTVSISLLWRNRIFRHFCL